MLNTKKTTAAGCSDSDDQKTGCLAAGSRRFELILKQCSTGSVSSPLVCHQTPIIRQQTLTWHLLRCYFQSLTDTNRHTVRKSTSCRSVPMVTWTNRSQLLTEDEDLCRPIKENAYIHILYEPADTHTHTHTSWESAFKASFFCSKCRKQKYNGNIFSLGKKKMKTAKGLSNQVRERKSNLPEPFYGTAHS